jgi:hypothetical protein
MGFDRFRASFDCPEAGSMSRSKEDIDDSAACHSRQRACILCQIRLGWSRKTSLATLSRSRREPCTRDLCSHRAREALGSCVSSISSMRDSVALETSQRSSTLPVIRPLDPLLLPGQSRSRCSTRHAHPGPQPSTTNASILNCSQRFLCRQQCIRRHCSAGRIVSRRYLAVP